MEMLFPSRRSAHTPPKKYGPVNIMDTAASKRTMEVWSAWNDDVPITEPSAAIWSTNVALLRSTVL